MIRLNKYLGLYILENKYELEGLLYKIDFIKDKMIQYPWINDINESEIIEIYYRHINTDIMVIDSIIHHLHLKDPTLRDNTYLFVAYYKNVRINFFTGLMSPTDNSKSIEEVTDILSCNNILFPKMEVCHTSNTSKKNINNPIFNEAIYITFLSIDAEIDRNKIKELFTIFPNGYVE